MPFAKVLPLASDLAKAKQLAQQGNIDLFAGQPVPGKPITLRGEITDANCFLSTHAHAYDHAFCAKLCAAAGNPLLFIPDQGAQPYLVLPANNAAHLPEAVLDKIGIPGILIKGNILSSDGVSALAIESLAQ